MYKTLGVDPIKEKVPIIFYDFQNSFSCCLLIDLFPSNVSPKFASQIEYSAFLFGLLRGVFRSEITHLKLLKKEKNKRLFRCQWVRLPKRHWREFAVMSRSHFRFIYFVFIKNSMKFGYEAVENK